MLKSSGGPANYAHFRTNPKPDLHPNVVQMLTLINGQVNLKTTVDQLSTSFESEFLLLPEMDFTNQGTGQGPETNPGHKTKLSNFLRESWLQNSDFETGYQVMRRTPGIRG